MSKNLKSLQESLASLEYIKDAKVREVRKAGCTEFGMQTEGYLVDSINELWDLILMVAKTRMEIDIRNTARKQIEFAQKVLGE